MIEPGVVAHAGRGKLDVCEYGSIDTVSSSLLEQVSSSMMSQGGSAKVYRFTPGCAATE